MRYVVMFLFLFGCYEAKTDQGEYDTGAGGFTDWITVDDPVAPERPSTPPVIVQCCNNFCLSNIMVILDSVDADEIPTVPDSVGIWLRDLPDYCFAHGWRLPNIDELSEYWSNRNYSTCAFSNNYFCNTVVDAGFRSLEYLCSRNGGALYTTPMSFEYTLRGFCAKDN